MFLLGASEAVVAGVAAHYENPCANLTICGWRNGYWQGEEEEVQVVSQVRDSRADLLFVAISSPQKEEFLDRHQGAMQVPFAMGVGGSFDVVVGKVKRAPRWMQRAGLEWFYRFLQEPRRMFRRYFLEDTAFVWLLLKEMAARERKARSR